MLQTLLVCMDMEVDPLKTFYNCICVELHQSCTINNNSVVQTKCDLHENLKLNKLVMIVNVRGSLVVNVTIIILHIKHHNYLQISYTMAHFHQYLFVFDCKL